MTSTKSFKGSMLVSVKQRTACLQLGDLHPIMCSQFTYKTLIHTDHNSSAYQQTFVPSQETTLKFPALRTKGLELQGETYSF